MAKPPDVTETEQHMTLQSYFQNGQYKAALDQYALVAAKLDWRVGTRVAIYNDAKIAFSDSGFEESERRAAFDEIYGTLKIGWHIFRGRGDYWTASQVFDALTEPSLVFARQTGLNLLTIRPDTSESANALTQLGQLSKLKQNNNYPWMAVSKFTHFLNPSLFPIYDKAVIWNDVMNDAFKTDYRSYRARRNLNKHEAAAHFNLNYTLWAGELVQGADDDFMPYFADWFKGQNPKCQDAQGIQQDIGRYYATAFEFVAIGAADIVKTTR